MRGRRPGWPSSWTGTAGGARELSDGPSRLVRYLDVVVAPALHLVKGDLAARLEEAARRGASVLVTALSGRADEDDNAFLADVPGPLAPLLGIRIDEWDARPPDVVNPVLLGTGPDAVQVAARLVFELVLPRGAETVGTYQEDFYAGTPAVTRHRFGTGEG